MPRVEESTMKVLVLDDEPFMGRLLARMLGDMGFRQVVTCDSGHRALELLDGPNADVNLILCDLNMPEMDGVEFMRNLVGRRYAGSLILVSGEDERILQTAERLVKANHLSVLGHLQKPAQPAHLSALLARWSPSAATVPRLAKKQYGPDELRAAIANHELVNFYQPQVAVASGQVVGVETLVRWRHPSDGLILPDQFIGVAEEHDLIDDLTRVVLVGALSQARVWQEASLHLRVAVNLSMDNLTSLAFPDFVAAVTAEAGIAPPDVVLEVTESRLMKNPMALLDILTRLRLKRFSLSIDDFGTGHSSLAQLGDIPFNELKIDRSFVHGACRNDTIRALFNASYGVAKQLGMEIVAEGVEDREDWDFLRHTGCDLAQGYFIARPMPAADLPGWMVAWETQAQDPIIDSRDEV